MKLKIIIYPPTDQTRIIIKSNLETDGSEVISQEDDIYCSKNHTEDLPRQITQLVELENKIVDLVKSYFNN